ncbi:MAG: hypothetical protein ACTSRU_07345 [Candidatus Hodarchaeales archaeon]
MLGKWKKKIKIKQFLTESEDIDSIKTAMDNIAEVIKSDFPSSLVKQMQQLPETGFLSYSNHLLSRMYDIADLQGIWLE